MHGERKKHKRLSKCKRKNRSATNAIDLLKELRCHKNKYKISLNQKEKIRWLKRQSGVVKQRAKCSTWNILRKTGGLGQKMMGDTVQKE